MHPKSHSPTSLHVSRVRPWRLPCSSRIGSPGTGSSPSAGAKVTARLGKKGSIPIFPVASLNALVFDVPL